MSTCSGCHRTIGWIVLLPQGKRHPIDPEPTVTGNIRITHEARPRTGVIVARAARQVGEELYASHFATCTQAAKFRSRKR